MKKLRFVVLCKECRYYDPDLCQCKRYQKVKALFQPDDFCSWGIKGIPAKYLLEQRKGNNKPNAEIKHSKKEIEIMDKIREEELENKKQEYADYIDKHCENVRKAFDKYGEKICEILSVDYELLKDLVDKHDTSKYEGLEFEYYRQYFYPVDGEEKSEDKFKYGWLFHQNNNPHHPEYWICRDSGDNIALAMPKHYIAEMILDWEAMSMVKGGSVSEFYNKSGKYKVFNPDSRDWVELVIKRLY